MENSTLLQIRIDNGTKKKLIRLAKSNGVNMSGMVRFLILREANLDKLSKKTDQAALDMVDTSQQG
jgi:antitoxin component of RelBE/YafQ-DinJ toxin-antitoxin module